MKQQIGLKFSLGTNKLVCNCVWFSLGVLAGVEVEVTVLIEKQLLADKLPNSFFSYFSFFYFCRCITVVCYKLTGKCLFVEQKCA